MTPRPLALTLALLALLLAACVAPPAPPSPTSSATSTRQPTTRPPTSTATATAVSTPTSTPLPPGLREWLPRLQAKWGVAATFAPATPRDVERLGVGGSLYRLELESGGVVWVSERGEMYAVRPVPAHWRYERGERIEVPAHEELVEVVEFVHDLVEFSHWGDGRVVRVRYEDGHEGWMYLDEQGQWAKIYESGFDYEFLSEIERHFEEVKGTTIEEWVGLNMGGGTFGAVTDLDRIRSHPEVSWWEAAFHGVFAGSGWVKLSEGGSGFVVVEAFFKYDRERGENDMILIPVWVGAEKDGQWQSLIGGTEGRIWFMGDKGDLNSQDSQVVAKIFDDENLGKAIFVGLEVYDAADMMITNNGKRVAQVGGKYRNAVLNLEVVTLIQEGKLTTWGMWFAGLPQEEQEALLASSERGKGILPWIVFEDTEKLEELLQRYPLPKRPVGFVASTIDVNTRIQPSLGQWVFP